MTNTLHMSLQQVKLPNFHIIRCHRSFVVNLDHVIEVGGNAQGLKLHLNMLEDYIPVSRKYIPVVQQNMP